MKTDQNGQKSRLIQVMAGCIGNLVIMLCHGSIFIRVTYSIVHAALA